MNIRNQQTTETKVEQQMTAMIDVVFQLLTFFVMSFQVATTEGDFSIKMPLGTHRSQTATQELLKLRLQADANGELIAMKLNSQVLPVQGGWEVLRSRVLQIVATTNGPAGNAGEDFEVELDCDYNLNYSSVIDAMTAVSGYATESGSFVKLVEKVKFSAPRGGGS